MARLGRLVDAFADTIFVNCRNSAKPGLRWWNLRIRQARRSQHDEVFGRALWTASAGVLCKIGSSNIRAIAISCIIKYRQILMGYLYD